MVLFTVFPFIDDYSSFLKGLSPLLKHHQLIVELQPVNSQNFGGRHISVTANLAEADSREIEGLREGINEKIMNEPIGRN